MALTCRGEAQAAEPCSSPSRVLPCCSAVKTQILRATVFFGGEDDLNQPSRTGKLAVYLFLYIPVVWAALPDVITFAFQISTSSQQNLRFWVSYDIICVGFEDIGLDVASRLGRITVS